jgi:Uncharacterised protein family UPF0102
MGYRRDFSAKLQAARNDNTAATAGRLQRQSSTPQSARLIESPQLWVALLPALHLLCFGCRGEDEAFFHLRKLGFTVVARNYRLARRGGDIDLIALEKDKLCFVEVKTRSRRNFIPAEAAADAEK